MVIHEYVHGIGSTPVDGVGGIKNCGRCVPKEVNWVKNANLKSLRTETSMRGKKIRRR